MTKRDFFKIVIKLFGLYSLIIAMFTFIPQNISNILMYLEEIWMLLIIFGSILLIVALFLILLFKTDFIIDKLALDKGFDDEKIILGDFKNEQIFKLAIIFIGGFLIIDYFPEFLFHLINSFKKEVSNYGFGKQGVDYFNLIVCFLNIILGYFLISNYKKIAQYLDR